MSDYYDWKYWRSMHMKSLGIYNKLSVDVPTTVSLFNKLGGFVYDRLVEVDLSIKQEVLEDDASFHSK